MKKVFALLSVLVLLLTSLCSGAAFAAAPATITVFGWGNGAEMDSHKAKVDLFNETNELGLTASIEVVPGAEYMTKLNAMLAAGNAPDVLMESADFNGFYYRNGNFENLTPYVERDGLVLEDLLLPGIDNGNVHGDNYREAIPFTGNAMAIAYNKDLFDEMGVAYPTNDWTWADFLAVCEKMTKGEGGTKQYAICDHWAVKTFAPYAGGGQLYDLTADPPVMTASDPKTIRGIEMYIDLMQKGFMPNSVTSQELPSEQRFFAGLGSMVFFFTWDSVNFSASIADAFEWDVVQMPKNDDGEAITLSWTTGFAMNKDSQNKDAAWEFIKFACLSEASNRQNTAVGMPALQSLIGEYSQQMIEGTDISLNAFIEAMSIGKINPLGGAFSPLADEYTRAWDAMVLQGADIAQTMGYLQQDGQPVLDELVAVK